MRRLKHWRFLLSFALGCAIWGVLHFVSLPGVVQILAAVDGAALIYLGLMFHLSQTQDADDLRHHAQDEDEGITLILCLALGVTALSLTGIIQVLIGMKESVDIPEIILAFAAVPLGWAMLHTVAAFHYAYLYYARKPEGGLDFPGGEDPKPWDFIYFAFGIGMTAQVSDVTITLADLRNVVTFHAVGSFFYNTVIVALSVNAAVNLAS